MEVGLRPGPGGKPSPGTGEVIHKGQHAEREVPAASVRVKPKGKDFGGTGMSQLSLASELGF